MKNFCIFGTSKLKIMRKNLIMMAAALLLSLAAVAQNVETLDVSKEANGHYSKQHGELMIEGEVLNGQKVGTWYEMYANKQLVHRIIQFDKGLKNGVCIEIDETGALVKKNEYAADKLNGTSYSWSRGGRLTSKNSYKNDVLDGEQIQCYEQGNNKEIAHYKNGLRDGLTTWFDQSGMKVMTIEYKNGVFDGKQETFYKTGGVKTSKMFKNNVQDGPAYEYYEGGSPKSECNYKKGKISGNIKTFKDIKPYVGEKTKELEKEKPIQPNLKKEIDKEIKPIKKEVKK